MNLQTIKLIGGAIVTLDLSQRATCKKCGKSIKFAATKNNKLIPIIEIRPGEWQAHFADCEYADEFRGQTINNRIREEENNQEALNNL